MAACLPDYNWSICGERTNRESRYKASCHQAAGAEAAVVAVEAARGGGVSWAADRTCAAAAWACAAAATSTPSRSPTTTTPRLRPGRTRMSVQHMYITSYTTIYSTARLCC